MAHSARAETSRDAQASKGLERVSFNVNREARELRSSHYELAEMVRAALNRAVGYERGIRARPPVQPRSDAAAGDNYADVCPVRGGDERRRGAQKCAACRVDSLRSALVLSRAFLVVARACWWTHLHNVAPIPIASGISMHSDGRSCACSSASLFVLHARERASPRGSSYGREQQDPARWARVGRGGERHE